VDFTGTTGANPRLCEVLTATSAQYIDGLDIVGTSDLRLVDMNSEAGVCIMKGLDLSEAPSPVLGFVNVGGTMWVDYVVNGGRTSTRASQTVTIDGSGTSQIALESRYAKVLFVVFVVTAAGHDIDNIGVGGFRGQEMSITNKFDSTQSIDLTAGNRIKIGSTVTLTAAAGIRLRWDGTDWVRA
jgi:hypothetical protein